jgi:hypothetical protein
VGAGTWIGVRGLQARSDLEAALPLASTLKTQALAGDSAAAGETLAQLSPLAARARSLTSDPVWRAAEFVPFVGANLSAVRVLASATDSVVTGAVTPLLSAAAVLDPSSFKPVGGAVDTAPFVAAAPAVTAASGAVESALAEVNAIDTSGTLAQLGEARDVLSRALTDIKPTLDSLDTIVPLLPRVLGAETPRSYLLMFQNNAEARALGGVPGSMAIVTVDHGRISLGQVASGRDFPHNPAPLIPVPDGVLDIYHNTFGTWILDSTVRPSFSSTAEFAMLSWQSTFGVSIDGIISIDAVALSYILRATGPVELASGEALTSDNAVSQLLNGVYLRFPGDTHESELQQDDYFQSVISAAFGKVSAGDFDPKQLVDELARSWSERRVLFWSSHSDEQAELAAAGLNGELPQSDANTDRIGLYFADAIGSKMDYYLQQSVTLSSALCRSDGRASYRVSVDLSNLAPLDAATSLSTYILGKYQHYGLRPAYINVQLLLYAPPGSTIENATVGGAGVPLEPLHDTDYPVARVVTDFAPGSSQKVTFDVVAPRPGKRDLAVDVTPLVHPTEIARDSLDCATVAAG